MIATFNEKHHAAEFAAARVAGGKVGAMVRAHGWVAADQTIARAAVGYVSKLPLYNLGGGVARAAVIAKIERELQSAFVVAAHIAATAEVEA
jgi:hypothetical protein